MSLVVIQTKKNIDSNIIALESRDVSANYYNLKYDFKRELFTYKLHKKNND